MREYHVDTHPIFTTVKYNKVLLVNRDLSLTSPLMIIRQDKTVFKQYLFSRKCWVGPGRETQLLPKSNSYSRMISGFLRHSFGVGLHLSDIELNRVNEMRMGCELGNYLPRNEAITVYKSKKKRKISDNLTLLRFFEAEILHIFNTGQ